jgi:general L-amino acid transport system permease protein
LVARLATIYVEALRNVPLLLQLLFWYNAVLKPLPGPRESISVPGLAFGLPTVADAAALVLAFIGWLVSRSARTHSSLAWKVAAPILGPLLMGLGFLGFLFGPGFMAGQGGGVISLAGSAGIFLNNRGLILPEPRVSAGFDLVLLALGAGIVGALGFYLWARRRQMRTGAQQPITSVALALVIGLPLVVFFLAGRPMTLEPATLRGFNFQGGVRVLPEIFALLLGLVLYTATFIAEIVRAGIQSVARGQTEAAQALGLRAGPTLKLVVIPQAMRVIIPPLTNQYLNLTKNSSLAVFIGYPDLVQVFAGTVLNQTGAAVQVISITMAVYLLISLITSLLMGLYNRRMSLRER